MNKPKRLIVLFVPLFAFIFIYGAMFYCPPDVAESATTKTPAESRVIKESLTTETYKITAYCPCEKCCGRWADGITASGHEIQKGDKFCAADSSIPFGTILNIPEYGKVKVLDRGGVIKGNRIDVYFDTHAEALNWGVKYLAVRKEGV